MQTGGHTSVCVCRYINKYEEDQTDRFAVPQDIEGPHIPKLSIIQNCWLPKQSLQRSNSFRQLTPQYRVWMSDNGGSVAIYVDLIRYLSICVALPQLPNTPFPYVCSVIAKSHSPLYFYTPEYIPYYRSFRGLHCSKPLWRQRRLAKKR